MNHRELKYKGKIVTGFSEKNDGEVQ